MQDFVAIDFETANKCPSSVCSVGLIIVRGGVVVDKIYSLIHPYPNYYLSICTEVHGLSRSDTDNAPKFPEVWAKIAPRIEGLPLVAHNARFDKGCLIEAYKAYRMNYPDYTFFCTLTASRKVFGKMLPNHQLHTVSAKCGYDLENHHNALADAEACAAIAMKII